MLANNHVKTDRLQKMLSSRSETTTWTNAWSVRRNRFVWKNSKPKIVYIWMEISWGF